MKKVLKIQTTNLNISVRPDGIIEIRARAPWQQAERLEHAIENYKAIAQISNQSCPPLICWMSDNYVDREAQEYYRDQPPLVSAVALVVNSPIQRTIGNFFIKFKKLPNPTRLFTDEKKAILWLKSFLKDGATQKTKVC